jgi:hypothetical protein
MLKEAGKGCERLRLCREERLGKAERGRERLGNVGKLDCY